MVCCMTYIEIMNVLKYRNVLKDILSSKLTMEPPIKNRNYRCPTIETLSVKQFSAKYDMYYGIFSQIIISNINDHKKNI